MKMKWLIIRGMLILTVMILSLTMSTMTLAQGVQKWKLVNPEGIVVVKPVEIAPRQVSLEGKTVLLRWNGKHNGNNFLDRVAENLTQQVKGVKIIKMWEAVPGSNGYPMKDEHFQAALKLKPDFLIATQAD
jgi:hypothetical protein